MRLSYAANLGGDGQNHLRKFGGEGQCYPFCTDNVVVAKKAIGKSKNGSENHNLAKPASVVPGTAILIYSHLGAI